jgi:hypothetical protein
MAALKNCLVGSRTILPGGGKLFGSVPPPSPQLWEGFSKYFTVTTYARNFYTKKEKEIDVDFALSAQEFAFENPTATIILVGGDRDFTPLLTRLARRGHFIEVWGWKRAYADIICCLTAGLGFYDIFRSLLKILIIKEIIKLIILLHILAIRILFPRKQRGPAAIIGT